MPFRPHISNHFHPFKIEPLGTDESVLISPPKQ